MSKRPALLILLHDPLLVNFPTPDHNKMIYGSKQTSFNIELLIYAYSFQEAFHLELYA